MLTCKLQHFKAYIVKEFPRDSLLENIRHPNKARSYSLESWFEQILIYSEIPVTWWKLTDGFLDGSAKIALFCLFKTLKAY